ncbi:MAG: HPr family phosphocarrier protein [Lachnospiraceae bacterium]|nr:HPr family phosphocarrier protein [Lachnospiraceae bacterium]
MRTVKVRLNSIDKVKRFVNEVTKTDFDMDLVSGRYVIDAKSIMGIFSLDLSKDISMNIHSEDEGKIAELLKSIDDFIVA